MWPFDWKERRERRWLLRAFSPYLSKDRFDGLMAEASSFPRPMESKEIHFLLLQVRDDDADEARPLVVEAVATACDRGGVVECMMSSFVLVTFGLYAWEQRPPAELMAELAGALLERMGSNIRIAYGRARGLHGLLGSEKRFAHTALLPGFGRYTATLLSTDFGSRVVVGDG
jgi:hypothetical protein